MNDEQEHDGVELEQCTSEDGAKGDAIQDPTLLQPVSHEGIQTQRRRNGSALEELALARGVLGQNSDSNVETSKSGQSTQNKKGETKFISRSSKANGEGDHSGSDTERDLQEMRALVSPSTSTDSDETPDTISVGVAEKRRTKSARESSSCPIRLLFFLHRATLPSRKSKNKPNGRNVSAHHR